MGNFFGSGGNNTFTGIDFFNFYATLSGNDTVRSGLGYDFAFLGTGNDTYVARGLFGYVSTGLGDDTISLESGATMVSDFGIGADKIDLSSLVSIDNFSDLTIFQGERGAFVGANGVYAILEGVNASQLSADDFVFTKNETLISFEDFDTGGSADFLPAEYQGFEWTNWTIAEDDLFPLSGLEASSGSRLGVNGFGELATISRDERFDLESFYASAAWEDGLVLTVEGFLDGASQGSQDFNLVYGDSRKFELDDSIFGSVDFVMFTTTPGSDHSPNDSGSGSHFAMDDILIFG